MCLSLTNASKRVQKLLQSRGNSTDHFTRVPILREQERELQLRVFFQCHLLALVTEELIGCVFSNSHNTVNQIPGKTHMYMYDELER